MISKLISVVLCAVALAAPVRAEVHGVLSVSIKGREVADASVILTNRGRTNLCFDYMPSIAALDFRSASGDAIENNGNEGTIVITGRPATMFVAWADGKPHKYDLAGAFGPTFKTDADAARAAKVSLTIPLHDCATFFADPNAAAMPLRLTVAPTRSE